MNFWLVQIENLLAKIEFLLVCGLLAAVSVEPWHYFGHKNRDNIK